MGVALKSKGGPTRRKLDALAAQQVKIDEADRRLREEYAEAEREAVEAREALADSLAEAFVTDGSPASAGQAALHARLAKADVRLRSSSWQARRDGLHRARRKLDADARQACEDGFDELAGELREQGEHVDGLVAAALEAVHTARTAWDALAARWVALERGAGLAQHVRLDLPPFPLIDVPDGEPVSAVPFQLVRAIDLRDAQEAEQQGRTAQSAAVFVGDAEHEAAA